MLEKKNKHIYCFQFPTLPETLVNIEFDAGKLGFEKLSFFQRIGNECI